MEVKMTAQGVRKAESAAAALKPAAANRTGHGKEPRLDTYEPAAGRPFGEKMLTARGTAEEIFPDGVPSPGTLELYDPDKNDGINWERLEKEVFQHTSVTLESGDALEGRLSRIASAYVAVKHTLEQKYGEKEDILAEKMGRLDTMLERARTGLANSYKQTVGSFFERLGNPGIVEDMGKSVSIAMDQKIAQMEADGRERGLFEKDYSYEMLSLVLNVGDFVRREEGAASPFIGEGEQPKYSIEDLTAAASVAKTASRMDPRELNQMSEKEIGLYLSVKYMKMVQAVEKMGIGKEMSGLLLKSFGSFLDQYSGGKLSGKGAASSVYSYAVKKYHSTKDMKEAVAAAGKKYIGDGFASEFHQFGGRLGMAMSTRYNLEIAQFLNTLSEGNMAGIMQSIAGNRNASFSAYV